MVAFARNPFLLSGFFPDLYMTIKYIIFGKKSRLNSGLRRDAQDVFRLMQPLPAFWWRNILLTLGDAHGEPPPRHRSSFVAINVRFD
jgi:hypothetical protein